MSILKQSVTFAINTVKSVKFTSFYAVMMEALQKLKDENEAKSKEPAYKSRYTRKFKRRKWEDRSKDDESSEKRVRTEASTEERIKRRKHAILLGYSGINYYGMQRNPLMKTIEHDLLLTMRDCKWINEEGFLQARTINFQRAARTDKGVSAARQCCSLKLPDGLEIKDLNAALPAAIRVFALKRVTKGFNSKEQCDARTYSYTLPTIAFADDTEKCSMETYRTTVDKINEVNKILKIYQGTNNFHNFTSRKAFNDPSAKRYMLSFICGEPFIENDVEYVIMKVKGQSFMLHQIRKMVGLVIAIVRGLTTEDTIKRAFGEERLDIPIAPGLGLVLEEVHYDRYNQRYGEDGIHEPLKWDNEEPEIQKFAKDCIYSTIFAKELEEKSMATWLETLKLHSYDVRNDKNGKSDEEESNANSDSN